jgi:hypothetical protein
VKVIGAGEHLTKRVRELSDDGSVLANAEAIPLAQASHETGQSDAPHVIVGMKYGVVENEMTWWCVARKL